jgi:hypothetical protein
MKRFRTGWDLTKKSWRLLRGQPGLTAYPVLGGVLSALALLLFAGPGFYLLDTDSSPLGYVLIAVGVYLASLAATFFGVGFAAAADRAFKGEDVTLGTGVAVARGRFGAIAGWAFVSAVVGTAISLLQSQRGLAGPILGALGGAVVLFGVLPAVLLIVVGVVLWSNDGSGDAVALGAVVTLIGAVLLCVSIVVSQALRQIFGIALYRYTADGDVVPGFTDAELASAVRTR